MFRWLFGNKTVPEKDFVVTERVQAGRPALPSVGLEIPNSPPPSLIITRRRDWRRSVAIGLSILVITVAFIIVFQIIIERKKKAKLFAIANQVIDKFFRDRQTKNKE